MNENTEAFQLAKSVSDSGKMSPYDIGKIAISILSETNEQQNGIISEAVYTRVKELGGSSQDADIVSSYIANSATNQKIKKAERNIAINNQYYSKITEEMKNADNNWFAEIENSLAEIKSVHNNVLYAVSPSKNNKSVNEESTEDTVNNTENNPQLTEAEQKLLNTPDEQLTPEQRAVKQNIIERQEKSIAQNGDVGTGNVIDISTDNELSKLLVNIHGSDKYKKIKEYILGLLGGRDVKLSDGKNAIVDGRDAQHIASNAGSKKIAQISQLKEIIKNSKLVAEEDSTKEKKFDYFYYYEVVVKDGKEEYPIYLNVGRARNDGTYHIYDITQKLRDTAHRVNDVWRPVGNAIENGISDITVPQNAQSVNNIISTDTHNNSQNPDSRAVDVAKNIGDRVSILRNNTNRRHTTLKEQQYIRDICNLLSREVVFEDIAAVLRGQGIEVDSNNIPDGYIDENNAIHIGWTVYNPVQFILKHELTHFGEGTEAYETFIEAVQKSKVYIEWLQKKTGSDSKSLGKLEALYREAVMQSREKTSPVGAAKAQNELYADFCGDVVFSERGLKALADSVSGKHKPKVIQFVLDFFAYLKQKFSGNKQFTFELARLESKYADMLRAANETTVENSGEVRYSIVNLDNGKSYVQASRKIIFGENVSEWRKQISNFFNNSLKNGSIEIKTVEGDILTITKETADKARDRNITENGVSRRLTDNEFLVKLRAESHIDELAEISISQKTNKGKKNIIEDTKNHSFAKDGFTYRTVYFQDFDGGYYKISLSIGENNGISTVYNVGKIKADDIPNGNIVSAIGSKADMSSANSMVAQKPPTVKNNSMQGNKKYSIPTDTAALLERYDSGEISREEYIEQLDELWGAANERYGTIEQGENPKTAISVPKQVQETKKTTRWARTFIESGKLTAEMIEDVEQEILLGDLYSYTVESDEKAQKKAAKYFERGTAEEEWYNAINNRPTTKTDIAIGERLLTQAIEKNDRLKVLEISSELADAFTRAGQVEQAARMFKKMTGIGMLVTAQRNIKTINKDLDAKYGDGKVTVRLDPLLAEQLANAKSLDDIEIVYKNVLQDEERQGTVLEERQGTVLCLHNELNCSPTTDREPSPVQFSS